MVGSEGVGGASLLFRRWATKKAGGSTQNGRDSKPKNLGVKKYGGQVSESALISIPAAGLCSYCFDCGREFSYRWCSTSTVRGRYGKFLPNLICLSRFRLLAFISNLIVGCPCLEYIHMLCLELSILPGGSE